MNGKTKASLIAFRKEQREGGSKRRSVIRDKTGKPIAFPPKPKPR